MVMIVPLIENPPWTRMTADVRGKPSWCLTPMHANTALMQGCTCAEDVAEVQGGQVGGCSA